MKRLFIAIDIENEIKAYIESSLKLFPGQKWTNIEQQHITLKFLGDTEEDLFSQIRENLKSVNMENFSISIQDTGFFPNIRRPNVFWLGITPEPKLIILKNEIDNLLSPLGIQPDDREFSPHLTLMRIKYFKDRSFPEKLNSRFSSFKKQTFQINSFILYSSVLDSSGAIHKKEEEYFLK